jgi:thiamine-phosphate pyrophosphorylase
MSRFALHHVTDPAVPHLTHAVVAASRGGVDVVQLRAKSAPALEIFDQVRELRSALSGSPCALLVNDRIDVALAGGAAGVHLAAKSLPVAAARSLIGHLLLGRSVHSLEEAVAAAEDGADYVTYGHVYPTKSKPGVPPRSLTELGRVVQQVPVAVIAIGGITADNVEPVLETGCAGIAVISAILDAPDPGGAAGRLREALDACRTAPLHPFPTLVGAHQ